MITGKLEWKELDRIIKNFTGVKKEDVVVRSGIGEDCSVVNFGEYDLVLSTDPITAAKEDIGGILVNINCNDLASAGVLPLGIMVTILAPPTVEIKEIEKVMSDINRECIKLNIEVIGGHTEVTDAVNKVVVSATVIGKTEKGKAVETKGARVGDSIIVTKKLCIEGTYILVNDYCDEIQDVLTKEEIKKANQYKEQLSVVKEGVLSGKFGVNSMHDITEGGVLGALCEVVEASQTGFEVCYNNMPISDITIKLCKYFKIDPLKFISSGSMLICSNRGEGLIKFLKENGIEAYEIGKIKNEGKILIKNGKKIEVELIERDEIYKL
ncbi:AIR synthase family protein [Clostridium sp. DL1XJH146]